MAVVTEVQLMEKFILFSFVLSFLKVTCNGVNGPNYYSALSSVLEAER